MRGDAKDVLVRLSRAGVDFSVCIPHECGSQDLAVTVEQALLMLSDPIAVKAGLLGVSRIEFQDWCAEGMSVRCSAKTHQRKRCRNIIAGGSAVSARKWADLTGGYCHCHRDADLDF